MPNLIDLKIQDEEKLNRAVERARQQKIIIPTLKQMIDPERIPAKVKQGLGKLGLWDQDPLNLFRINWHNQPQQKGGGFGKVNAIEIPAQISGTRARVISVTGKWFPTGSYKVGAAFGCLVPKLVTGGFDPTTQKAVWPSTGNYCRGGAYDSNLLSCDAIAILPEGMSRERFEWLENVAGEIIRTPGSESNVKEIFDKCNELKNSGQDLVIFNQFEEFGNYMWHYEVTGRAMVEVLNQVLGSDDCYRGIAMTTGSAGSIACGDYLKQKYPHSKIAASEALQCPTLLNNGFGAHRIEGIGDKHIPWVHNIKNLDLVMAIDDEATMQIMRLFNEPAGQDYLLGTGVPEDFMAQIDLIAISGIANMLSAAKMANYYEMTENDVVLTTATDSMEMYRSRLEELREQHGALTGTDAAWIAGKYLQPGRMDYITELTYYERKRIHNLKYYTWVEQQGKQTDELQAQWYQDDYWTNAQNKMDQLDGLIDDFNRRTGLLDE